MTPAATYKLEDEAAEDLVDVVEFYNAQQDGLGEELCDLLFLKLEEAVVPSPRVYVRHERNPRVHIYRLQRFPVRIFYRVDDDVVVVVAVEHMKAEPDRWRGRLIEPDEDE